ncbi:MAG: BlaI/MecI/CopY family transcriptional regulator [Candidatus Aenigmarchaeota archaeon]|nr:BlaI/MecI/CopY family transcriptional regulator [Candidatus Aenigmarchaeota archaeon]
MVIIERIRFHRQGYEAILSPLESSILEALWQKRKAKVRELHSILKKEKRIALTSVAVCLDRLHKKGIVMRETETGQGGVHYIYSPLNTRQDFDKSIVENVVDKLIYNFGDIAVNYFNERFSKAEPKKTEEVK